MSIPLLVNTVLVTSEGRIVRASGANSLLVHLKPPEVKKVELDIGVKANKEIDDFKIQKLA